MSNRNRSLNSLEDIEFAVKRIEELEAKLSESEALLAKAVEALDNVVVEYDLFRKYEYERGLSSLDDEIEDARTTHAELKGGKDE